MKKFLVWNLLFFSSLTIADEIPLRIGVVQEFGAFNPVTMNLASTESFIHFVMRELTTRDSQGQIIPDLAQKVPSIENKLAQVITEKGAKKIKATWSLQPEAKWSDGTTITCQDWWLGWQAGLSPQTATLEKSMYAKIEKIQWDAKTPQKCVVTYSNTSWTFDRDLPYPIPSHLEKSVFDKWKSQREAYDQNTLFVTNPSHAGLYSGPYRVQEFQLGSHILLTRNPHFYGAGPKIEKVMIKHIGDASTLQAHLKTKSINMISAVGFPPDQAISFSAEENQQPFQVFFQDSPIFQGLFINHENAILKERAVRQALSLSINKKKLTEAFFGSKLHPAETFIPPNAREFHQRSAIYNPKQAALLLEQAGWKAGAKGYRTKNGEELIIDFKTSSGIKILETLQVFICDEFSKIQVGCSIKNQPPRILLGDTITKGEFTLAMFGNSILPDTSLTSLFSSKEIPKKENSWTGGNNLRWVSLKTDALLTKFDNEPKATRRSDILKQIEKEILNDVALIPIYHRREAAVIPDGLTGLSYLSKGTNFMFPERWVLK